MSVPFLPAFFCATFPPWLRSDVVCAFSPAFAPPVEPMVVAKNAHVPFWVRFWYGVASGAVPDVSLVCPSCANCVILYMVIAPLPRGKILAQPSGQKWRLSGPLTTARLPGRAVFYCPPLLWQSQINVNTHSNTLLSTNAQLLSLSHLARLPQWAAPLFGLFSVPL